MIAWAISVAFSVPILLFFNLHETDGIYWQQLILRQIFTSVIFRLWDSMLDRLPGTMALAALYGPRGSLALHLPGPDHRLLLHPHRGDHLEEEQDHAASPNNLCNTAKRYNTQYE